ncbi:unnamed protein product, partial [Rhizoctonia solani]
MSFYDLGPRSKSTVSKIFLRHPKSMPNHRNIICTRSMVNPERCACPLSAQKTPDWDAYAQGPPKLGRRGASETLSLPAPTLAQELEQTVSSSMTCGDIIDLLTRHGSKNLTALFVPAYCSRYPVSTGGFGDVYRSHLLDGRKVAIKIVRVFESGEPGKYQKWAARELYAWSKCQ